MTATPVVPGYRLLHELGRGGMGVVWLARQESLDRLVAVKLLIPGAWDEIDRRRFLREGGSLAALAHPGIARLYDSQLEGAHPYLVCEYVEGARTLGQVIATDTLSPAAALSMGLAVAEALAHVHAQGLMHRDVKPGNVLIGRDGRPRLIDLGLARSVSPEVAPLTLADEIVGTLAYMAPEQFQPGGKVDARADVYALGLVLYELLVGRFVFAGSGPGVVGPGLRLSGAVPPARELALRVPEAADRVLARCLAVDPAARYADGSELAAAIRELVGESGTEVAQPPAARARAKDRDAKAGRKAHGKAQRAAPASGVRAVLPMALVGSVLAAVVLAVGVGGIAGPRSRGTGDAMSVGRGDVSKPVVSPSDERLARARELGATLQRVRSELDDRWLAGFAAAHRARLGEIGVPAPAPGRAAVGRALRAHLERIGVQPRLDRFLESSAAFFEDPEVSEAERIALRTALCDVELVELFCGERGIDGPAARPVSAAAPRWDEPVDPARLDLGARPSWVWRGSSYEKRLLSESSSDFFFDGLPAPGAGRALLWFSTSAWRSGFVLDVRVNHRVRRLFALRRAREVGSERTPGTPGSRDEPAAVEPPALIVRASQLRVAGVLERDVAAKLLAGSSWEGRRGYLACWIPASVLTPRTDFSYRVVALPLAGSGLFPAALRERVLTLFESSGTATRP